MTGVLIDSARKRPHTESPATRRQAEAAAMPASLRDAWGHGAARAPREHRLAHTPISHFLPPAPGENARRLF